MRTTAFILLSFLMSSNLCEGNTINRSSHVESLWRAFQSDPAGFMDQLPPRMDAQGRPIRGQRSPFTEEQVRDRSFVEIKSRYRINFTESEIFYALPVGPITRAEDPTTFVDEFKFGSLQQIDRAGLQISKLRSSPWSDYYWPIAKGGLAYRYGDPLFPGVLDWLVNFQYLSERIGNYSDPRELSPAEKYDLLIGDPNHTLTKQSLEEGRYYYESQGKVESWMGICHGWAPAATLLPRPSQSIEVLAADGKTLIPFFPSDIKALISLLWAKGSYSHRFLGDRCNIKDPKKDPNGRIIDPECFNSNPAVFHLVLVNQIGHSKRSFIMDATYDYEVWNQPVTSYRYSYFNPQTGKNTDKISEAIVNRREFTQDKFASYRSKKFASVVGVALDVAYVGENPPTMNAIDSPVSDQLITVRYLYDLELTKEGQIIGGEWYTNLHPDFLWIPEKNARARSVGDYSLGRIAPHSRWDLQEPMPEPWKNAALESSRAGQPLGRLVETLLTRTSSRE